MKNQFVSYEQSLALKELGFDQSCFGFYSTLYHLMITQTNGKKSLFESECLAPLKQQVFEWFRHEHNLYSEIRTFVWDYDKKELGFSVRTYLNPIDVETERLIHPEVYESYEEAESACIDKLIEIVKNK